jgi:octaprenyl-diphosphate synthase
VGKAGVAENLPRLADIVVMDQDTARQNTKRTFDDAHILVQHQMMDIGAIQERADSRNQHDIVGPNQFPQFWRSFCRSRRESGTARVNRFVPLPLQAALSMVISEVGTNWANLETGVAVIVPFESPSGASIDQLVGLVAADMARVNATILSRTGSEVTMIPEVANHLISSGGKRLRPMLTLAMAGLTGYSGDGHIKLAASVEFMHTATLLHDDVVDESELRRGKLSARMLWGNEASVLVGDFLLGQAFRMMVEVGSLRALDILSSAAATIAEGEVMQLAAAKNTATTEDEYLAVIRGKTAELFAAACEVGPVIANRPKAEQTACRSVGMNLGIAFQLVDDVLDYGGKAAKLGKNIGDDFREGKITLPVVLAFRRGNDSERAFWVKSLERGEIGDGDLDHAIGLMTKHRALEDTINRAQHYGAMAVDALALFPASPMKTALEQVVAFCLARSH